ncbi:MAG: hypothetical protein AB1656_13435 [Candidatus Omnitrophota bacterium]
MDFRQKSFNSLLTTLYTIPPSNFAQSSDKIKTIIDPYETISYHKLEPDDDSIPIEIAMRLA